MNDLATRANVIATARSLLLRDGDKFTVRSLCKESGLSRTKLRRTFPGKTTLISAVLSEVLAEPGAPECGAATPQVSDDDKGSVDGFCAQATPTRSNSHEAIDVTASPSTYYIDDEWIESRFRIVMRAVDALETQVETRCGDQSNSIAVLEQKLANVEMQAETRCDDQSNSIGLLEQKLANVEMQVEARCDEQSNSIGVLEQQFASAVNSPIVPVIIAEPTRLLSEQERQVSYIESDTIKNANVELITPSSAVLEQQLASAMDPPIDAGIIEEPPPLTGEQELRATYVLSDSINNANIEPMPLASVESAPSFSTHASLEPLPLRTRMRAILENGQSLASNATPSERNVFENRNIRFVALAAVAFVIVSITAGLIWSSSRPRARVAPAVTAERRVKNLSSVVVIDATGIPKPRSNEIAMSAHDLLAQAKSGNAQAQVALAKAFLQGVGEERNPLAAARWSQAAAEQGEPSAQFILGSLYANGIQPNPRLAVQWFTAAASHGNVKAMHNLGIAFLMGQGVTKDPAMAINWFSKAANLGYVDSEFDLAVLYERGEGVVQSPKDALKWYDKASSAGDREATQRASVLRTNLSNVAENSVIPRASPDCNMRSNKRMRYCARKKRRG